MKKVEITYEELFNWSGEPITHVQLPDDAFERLCSRYGIYGIDWYFVDSNTIKYYKNDEWHYKRAYIYMKGDIDDIWTRKRRVD